MQPTSQYKSFRRRRTAAPLIVLMLAAWAVILVLAACGEVRQGGPRTVYTDAQRPTLEYRK